MNRQLISQFCLSFAVLFNLAAARNTAAETPPNKAQVVEFCEQHLGQKVGNGECWTLAEDALHSAGFKGSHGNNPGKGDYVWGKLVLDFESGTAGPTAAAGALADVTPGDVIQFRDATFKAHGRWESFGHHTAVVRSVDLKEQTISFLQQNFGGKTVKEGKLKLPILKKGWIRVYDPVAK
jgi:hypothetical protein